MAYVSVPNDLTKIKSKLAFNLTKRQLVCFGGAALIGIPTYLLTRSAVSYTHLDVYKRQDDGCPEYHDIRYCVWPDD